MSKKHRFLEGFLSQDDLETINSAVSEAEKTTAGEIVVAIKPHSRWYCLKKNPIYAHAVHLFQVYGLKKTRDKTGILIFLSMAEQELQILADTGINAKVDPGLWQEYSDDLIVAIQAGSPCEGICQLVKKIGEVLTQYFPINPDDINELSNEVRV
ncbi:TPA: hypothetical protein DEP21_01670 [Patescibacteria group bacterium]|nr:hypothetical protein [Candidatus Gracilibacteria bacterium]